VQTKIIEDKTFGLKNKNKSKKVQDYVQSVARNVKDSVQQKIAGRTKTADEMKAEAAKKAKEAAAALEKEMAALTRAGIKQPKLEAGVDPKSVLCEFFKQGVCEKGDKCKFSHDLAIGRKAAKIDVYTDRRAEDDKKTDQMADWDQAKLEEVVASKHGAEKPTQTKTEIVCMYFLDAIEKEVYGWFWRCPNGLDCKYKHALPPGYVYKSKKQRDLETAAKLAEGSNQVSVEELIEEERRKLPQEGLTPVTRERFAVWKEARAKRRAAESEAKKSEEAKKATSKGFSALSGRALFSYDPSLFVDDISADETKYVVPDTPDAPETAAGAGGSGEDEALGDASLYLAEDMDGLDDIDEGEDEEDEGEDGDEDEEEGDADE
jgi:hypothetical protein